jgi:hypothetical protein
MQNKFLHNIQHIEIHGISDIDIERHIGNDNDDGEDYSNTIRELLLDDADIHGHRPFHAIERNMKPDTTRALFSKQKGTQGNVILFDIDNWICSKSIDVNNNFSFRESPEVRVFTSTIEQRKTQNKVKFNAYATRISKRCCSENPNKAIESFDVAPNRMPKRCINLTYTAAVTTTTPCQEQSVIQSSSAPYPSITPNIIHDTRPPFLDSLVTQCLVGC